MISHWGERSSAVTDSVTDQGGTWLYEFTVHNTTKWIYKDGNEVEWFERFEIPPQGAPIKVDWELPYFSDSGIIDVQSPDGWLWNIETIGTPNAATGWGGTAQWQDFRNPQA